MFLCVAACVFSQLYLRSEANVLRCFCDPKTLIIVANRRFRMNRNCSKNSLCDSYYATRHNANLFSERRIFFAVFLLCLSSDPIIFYAMKCFLHIFVKKVV